MLPANWAPGSAICLLCPQAVRNDFLGAYSPAPTAVIRCTWYGGEEAVCSEDPLCPQGLAALAGGHVFWVPTARATVLMVSVVSSERLCPPLLLPFPFLPASSEAAATCASSRYSSSHPPV